MRVCSHVPVEGCQKDLDSREDFGSLFATFSKSIPPRAIRREPPMKHGTFLPLRRCFQPTLNVLTMKLQYTVAAAAALMFTMLLPFVIRRNTHFPSPSSHYVQISSSQKHSRFIKTSLQPLQSLASPKHRTNLPAPWTTQHSCIRRSLVSVVVPGSTDNKALVTCGGEEDQFYSDYLSIHSSS